LACDAPSAGGERLLRGFCAHVRRACGEREREREREREQERERERKSRRRAWERERRERRPPG
jgi:hypothetical protein